MENRKFINFLISIFILGFFVISNNIAFAYDIETHAYLTSEIINFYNQHFSNQSISNELKDYLIDGSQREDDIPRWMNHFYDPVYNRGLTDSVLGTWQKSKDWARDSNNQNSLTYKVPATIASILTAIQQVKISALTTGTDFTWQRAIRFYAQGEKEKAMFMLGHILHLVEDTSVPDHTRNDPHPGDSPYENYTQKFTLSNPDFSLNKKLSNKSPNILSDLNSYFDELAKYSNNNFYSKDRIGIQSGYGLPEPDYINKDGIYFYGFKIDKENSDYHLLAYKKPPSKYLWAFNEEVTLKDEGQDFIISDYWSRLSTKSVQYGAGVINLFFQEVEKAKNSPEIIQENIQEKKSFFGQVMSAVSNVVGNVASTISETFSSVFSNQGPRNLVKEIPLNTPDLVNSQQPENKNFGTSTREEKQTTIVLPIIDPKISLDKTEVKKGEVIHQRGQGFTPNSRVLISLEPPAPNKKIEISILSDTKGNYDYVYLVPLDAALGTYFYSAADLASGKISAKLKYQVLGSKELEKKVVEETSPLLAATSSISATSSTSSLSKVSDTSLQDQSKISSPTFKPCSFATGQSPSHQKVIINEVAWMGTSNNASDEWIELKNISNSEVDLNGWQLIDKGEQIKVVFGQPDNRKIINKKILAGGFYLLERTKDNTLPTITADFVYTGVLSNSDEGLRLFDEQCNLIDEVLANPNWPAGDNTSATERKTMERDICPYESASSPHLSAPCGWHTSATSGGTPRQENTQLAPISTSGGGGGGTSTNNQQQTTNNQQQAVAEIKITEIMYDPKGNDTGREWIEIFNAGTSTVNLDGWKFSEGGSNHLLLVYRGSLTISPSEYAIIVDNPEKFLTDWSNYSGTIIDSSFSLNNTGETIAIKNGDLIVDQVNYQSSWGANDNGKSLQLINNEWKEIQPTPGQQNQISSTNQAPSAFFVYAPQNPQVDEEIIFDAASSTDDGQIVFYQWDFGDGATSTISTATTTHFYSQAGSYPVSLIIFDEQNASSTATSTTISVNSAQPAGVNHIVISEIQIRGDTANDEFIELYNPTNRNIPLDNFSIQYLSGTATSTDKIIKKNFSNGHQIAAKSFFLLINSNATSSLKDKSDMTYSGFSLSGNSSGATIFLVGTTTPIFDISESEIIDSFSYGAPLLSVSTATSTVPEANKSLERKAWQSNQCVSSQLDNEFLGNGCDTDSAADFEIRNTPHPQNSANLAEPREKPSINNLQAAYSPNPKIDFSWNVSIDAEGATSTNIYSFYDITDGNSTLLYKSSSSLAYSYGINEIGKNYEFQFEVQDRDGFANYSTTTIFAQSFFDGVYFYRDPRPGSDNYFVDLVTSSSRPLWDKNDTTNNQNWKLVMFYLNHDAPKQQTFDTAHWLTPEDPNFLSLKYNACHGYGPSSSPSLLIPWNNYSCQPGGPLSSAYSFGDLEDKRFNIKTASSVSDVAFSPADYLTLAFYDFGGGGGGNQYFNLAAVDKTKYYFQNEPPIHQPPSSPGPVTAVFNNNNDDPQVIVNWSGSNDPDTLDRLISYETNYALLNEPLASSSWQSLTRGIASQQISGLTLTEGQTYEIAVRAKDDFNLYSEIATTTFQMPILPLTLIDYSQGGDRPDGSNDWPLGYRECSRAAEKIKFNQTVKLDSYKIWLEQSGQNGYNARVSLVKASSTDENQPSADPADIISTDLVPHERIMPSWTFDLFNFNKSNNNIILSANQTYYLVVEGDNCQPGNSDVSSYEYHLSVKTFHNSPNSGNLYISDIFETKGSWTRFWDWRDISLILKGTIIP